MESVAARMPSTHPHAVVLEMIFFKKCYRVVFSSFLFVLCWHVRARVFVWNRCMPSLRALASATGASKVVVGQLLDAACAKGERSVLEGGVFGIEVVAHSEVLVVSHVAVYLQSGQVQD